MAEILKTYTNAQKKTLQNSMKKPNDKNLAKKAQAIMQSIYDKYKKLSDADWKIINEANLKFDEACGLDHSAHDYDTTTATY